MDDSARLLATILPLPQAYTVFWKRFVAATDEFDPVQAARRQLLAAGSLDLASPFPRVYIDPLRRGFLYVFRIASSQDQPQMLEQLSLENLLGDSSSQFTYSDIYRCVSANSSDHTCTERCSARTTSPELTRVYHHFLDAVREKIVYSVCEASLGRCPVLPLKDGFLLGQTHTTSEWGAGWDRNIEQRNLTQCYLQLHLHLNHILVRPSLTVSNCAQLEAHAPSGTPIFLLPHATPAYYIGKYNGAMEPLTQEFCRSLAGVATGEWWQAGYIICWIRVQNKQGAERGLTAVWPRVLAVASVTRTPLTTVPSTSVAPLSTILESRARSSLGMEALQASRCSTIAPRQDLRHLAASTSAYVDAVAKERERERERAREERTKRVEAPPAAPPPDPPILNVPPSHGLSQFYPSPPEFNSSMAPPPASASDNTWPDFGFNSTPAPAAVNTNVAEPADLEMASFDMFTEDDFDFFDQPGVQSTSNIIVDHDIHTNLRDHDPGTYGEMMMTPDSRWPPSGIGDPGISFPTPAAMEPASDGIDIHQVHHPLSPAKTPMSPPSPMTPRLDFGQEPVIHRTGGFDAIPFAESHLIADGKYSVGKFKFDAGADSPPSWTAGPGLRHRYDAITNPRVGIIRKLIGVKRKSTDGPLSPASSVAEDWQKPHMDAMDMDDSESDSEENHSTPTLHPESREESPTPAILPLGPGLLQSNFNHRQLLLLSAPSETSNLSIGSVTTPAPVSVPTPVSPAATFGAGTERAKILENVAYGIAREVVENSAWSEEWRMAVGRANSAVCRSVPAHELKQVADLIQRSSLLGRTLTLKEYLVLCDERPNGVDVAEPHLTQGPLEPPMVSIGQAGKNALHLQPSAMRFWEKLGLCPLGGPKPVTAFVFFEDDDHDRANLVELWLRRLGAGYSARGFGSHTPGSSGSVINGLVPLRWDSFRKVLGVLSTAVASSNSHIVFYILVTVPPQSAVFRQIMSTICRARKQAGSDEESIHFQLVPERLIHDHAELPETRRLGLEPFLLSVYDRVWRLLEKRNPRSPLSSPVTRMPFQSHAFNLARKAPPQVIFEQSWPPLTLDVIERHSMLHISYSISRDGEWLLASSVDERGEMFDSSIWGALGMDAERIVSTIWTFAMKHASKSSTEWRIVIVRWGSASVVELQAWCNYLDGEQGIVSSMDRPFHVSLLSAQREPALALIPPPLAQSPMPTKPTTVYPPGTLFIDMSSWTYIAFPQHQVVVARPSSIPDVNLVLEEDELSTTEEDMLPPSLLVPLLTAAIIRIPHTSNYSFDLSPGRDDVGVSTISLHLLHATQTRTCRWAQDNVFLLQDIATSYHDLTTLALERWNVTREVGLPLHIHAVNEMDWALEYASLN